MKMGQRGKNGNDMTSNSRYKLGGIVGIVTWLPRAVSGLGPHAGLIKITTDDTVEDPADKINVVNRDTPLLHINGEQGGNSIAILDVDPVTPVNILDLTINLNKARKMKMI